MSHRQLLPVFSAVLLLVSLGAWAATSADYYQAGSKLYQQKQYAQAEAYLKAAVQMDGNNWQAYQVLGLCYYEEGRQSEARDAIQHSLDRHPDNPSLRKFQESLQASSNPGTTVPGARTPSPVIGGGNFGLGLEFGGPGTWGATGKYWLDNQSAFQGALKLDGTVLQLQYLWHDYDLIHPSQGAFPFYIGIGGDLAFGGNSIAIAGCAPIGITYLFQKATVPVDIFVEGVPTLWFFSGGIDFQLYGNIGGRFYF